MYKSHFSLSPGHRYQTYLDHDRCSTHKYMLAIHNQCLRVWLVVVLASIITTGHHIVPVLPEQLRFQQTLLVHFDDVNQRLYDVICREIANYAQQAATLVELCRFRIRCRLKDVRACTIAMLPLPTLLRNYVALLDTEWVSSACGWF